MSVWNVTREKKGADLVRSPSAQPVALCAESHRRGQSRRGVSFDSHNHKTSTSNTVCVSHTPRIGLSSVKGVSGTNLQTVKLSGELAS